MTNKIIRRIQEFNQGRNPQLLQLKYQKIADNLFSFLRGTCHLFYQDWIENSPLNQTPVVWICGDLHLENFGSYQANDGQIYFDINDFDEAVLAPCTWEIARFLTSVWTTATTLMINDSDTLTLCNRFLDSYIHTISVQERQPVQKETAQGLVKELLESMAERKRKDFLTKRTILKKNRRFLFVDNESTYAITPTQRAAVTMAFNQWATQQTNPDFFKLLDLTGRIAGTGSLGITRYVALIEGNGSPNQNYLLDIKVQLGSSLSPYLKHLQPTWDNQADRVITVQRHMQAVPPDLLNTLMIEGLSYAVRELQPTQDKVDLKAWNGKLHRLEKLVETMGGITASAQLRSSAWQGSATVEELTHFVQDTPWREAVLDYARTYFVQVKKDWAAFCTAKKSL